MVYKQHLVRNRNGFGVLILGVLTLCFWGVGCSDPQHMLDSGQIDAHEQLRGHDGIAMDVWVIRARGSQATAEDRPTALLLHPMLMDKTWFLDIGKMLADRGWDVVLPDLRHHGRSGGKYITWGAKEKKDLKRVVDILIGKGLVSSNVYVMGASLGGCVAVQYAEYDSKRVKGCLSICPPTGVRGVMEQLNPLGDSDLIDHEVNLEARRGDYPAIQADAVRSAKHLKCPIILVLGTVDITVPPRQVRAIYAAAPQPKELIELFANHTTVQKGRDTWIVEQMQRLRAMHAKSTGQSQ